MHLWRNLKKITKGALIKAVKEGDIQTGSLMAGQIAGLISKEQSCKEIIKEMFDFKEVIKRLENFYE